ncbi:hypothetical protein C8A00DRAFT_35745 [Chaetomidium leptoderma]|uniref:Fungal STAND N-terminal Goodbye domain-containing protein n=1 Tax=Chaetomidium leptoderma TaxID=669021 RepID=A0AAN6ZUP2_9PEZI|nr:hypothetical protein C8A00DRAFT_35745 [Chaetomidium leptoderma]
MSSQSLEDMWEQARTRFSNLTGQTLPLRRSTSPDDLRKELEARAKEEKAKTTPELAKAEDAGLNILSCINMLGNVAAKGASMVFGPADLCFNAISMLLDVPKKVRAFHDAIDAVFEEVAPTLSQFKIYGRIDLLDKVDEDLKLAIHKVLISFVDICAKCINFKYGGKWDRIKVHTKRVLCDDQSVDDELKKFRTLVQGQQNVQNTVTLEEVLSGNRQLAAVLTKTNETGQQTTRIDTGVKVLVEAEGNRKSDAMRREQFDKLKVRLGVAEDATNNPKAVYEDMLKRSVLETGQWLASNSAYTSWADKRCASTGATLHLKGAPSTGKSFAVSAIIRRLKSEHSSSGSPDRSLVAYYFFPSVLTNKNDNEKGPTAESALKWICFQLAEQDAAYAKVVDEACLIRNDDWFKKASCEELWTTLRIGEPLRKTTHYVLLDGLDSLSKSAARQLFDIFRKLPDATMGASQPYPVRVLVCGKPEMFDDDLIKHKDCPVIEMEQNMAVDMHKYVHHELRALFPDRKSQERRSSIEKRLLEQPAFTFRSMQYTLDAIRQLFESTGAEEQLDTIIAKYLRDPTVIVREEVERMQVQLSARQIDLLNELLVWAIYGVEYLRVHQLEAALYLRFNETLLQGLGHLIEKKLSKMFTVDLQGRVLVMSEIVDIVVKARDMPRNMAEQPKISLEIKITNADRATVQRFLWDLSRHATLDNFSFRGDGTAASETPKSSIMVNEVDAHLAIVKSAMAFFRTPPNKKTEAIGGYLVRRLPAHLEVVRSATGLDKVGYDDKKTIGKFVFDLFDDSDILQRHWNACKSSGCGWFEATNVEILLGWLQDDAVVGSLGLSKSDMAWLEGIKRARNPGRRLLSRVMRMVATMWLRNRTGEAVMAPRWICIFLSLEPPTAGNGAETQSNSQAGTDDEAEGAEITISLKDTREAQFEAAEKWCLAVLRPTDEQLDSLWFERLGSAYANIHAHEKAVEAFIEAKRRPSPSWDVFEGLAKSLSAQNNQRGACDVLKLALEGQDPDMEAAVDVDTAQRAVAYSRLAEWHHELREPEAIRFSEKAYELCPDDQQHQYSLLRSYVLFGRDTEARALVVEAAGSQGLYQATGHRMSRLGLMLRYITGAESFTRYPSLYIFCRIVTLVSEPECRHVLSTLLHDITASIESAREEENNYERSALLICQGVAQLHDGKDDDDDDGPVSGGSGGQLFRAVLSSWRESYLVAKNNPHMQSGQAVDDLCELSTRLASWYLFEKLRHLVRGSASSVIILGELERFVSQHTQAGRISAAQCYLASIYAYYAARDQEDHESKDRLASKSRGIFASYMATVLGMLSDGDLDNNGHAFSMMYSVFLHTGDAANALAAMLLVFIPRNIPRRHLKNVLMELLGGPEGTQTDVQGEVANEIIGLLEETDDNLDDDNDDSAEAYRAVVQLVSKVKELHQRATKPEGGQQQQQQQQQQEGSKEDGQQEPPQEQQEEATTDDVPTGGEMEPRLLAYAGAIDILERLTKVLNKTWLYWCDHCQATWDFGNSMRACRFCHDAGLCQTCFEALQTETAGGGAQGGGHGGGHYRNRLLCGPHHEWLVLPRWDAKLWAESFHTKVRVHGSIEGDYSTVSASSWLRGIAKKWGFSHEDGDQVVWDL